MSISYGKRMPLKGPTLDTPINRIDKKIADLENSDNQKEQVLIRLWRLYSIQPDQPSVIDQYMRLLRIKERIIAGEDELLVYLSE